MKTEPNFTVTEFIDICNQSLEYSFVGVLVEGEVASFKISQGKWVFFDLKEGESVINCFMPLTALNLPLADGMKVRVRATPKVTRWGRFSLTVQRVLPLGEGSIKKSFELLKRKLTAEGLFDPARKRPLPVHPTKIGVISSTAAAGYKDFLKIVDNRWGGLQIFTINTQVQGIAAPEQIVRALQYFNEHAEVEVIAILRGGGSADDLSAFNDEQMVRAIASSRIPVITGIGHEIDESLADLAADLRASTPSNVAERLTPDRQAILQQVHLVPKRLAQRLLEQITSLRRANEDRKRQLAKALSYQLQQVRQHLQETKRILASLSPENVLQRGYAIITGKLSPGAKIQLTTQQNLITAEVLDVESRQNNTK